MAVVEKGKIRLNSDVKLLENIAEGQILSRAERSVP